MGQKSSLSGPQQDHQHTESGCLLYFQTCKNFAENLAKSDMLQDSKSFMFLFIIRYSYEHREMLTDEGKKHADETSFPCWTLTDFMCKLNVAIVGKYQSTTELYGS